MGFGFSGKIEAPKVEAPKVAAPKLDVAGTVAGLAAGTAAAVKGAASAAAATAKGAVGGAAGIAGKAGGAVSLSAVAGALADVSVSFKGGTEDAAMEPHMVLDANASYEETRFEKGPVWIKVELAPEKAKESGEILHLHSEDGAYDQEKRISAFEECGAKTVDVLFEEAPMNQAFTLEVVDEAGRSHTIFAKVAYGDLRKTRNRF